MHLRSRLRNLEEYGRIRRHVRRIFDQAEADGFTGEDLLRVTAIRCGLDPDRMVKVYRALEEDGTTCSDAQKRRVDLATDTAG